MKNKLLNHFPLALLAASLLIAPLALAQSNNAGTVGSSAVGATNFTDIIDQDVAKGYYSAEQGAQLKEQFESAQERVDASLEKGVNALQKTISIAQSGNQMTFNQLGSLISENGKNMQVGGTPEQIAEQAQAIYGAAHLQLEVTQAVIDNVKPFVQDYINEADQVVAARAELIKNNPGIDATTKRNATREASALHDAADHAVEKNFSTMTYQLQTAQASLDNNKSEIIAKVENIITTNTAKYGSDPKNWPQANTAQTTKPASTQSNTAASTARQPAANPAPSSTNAATTTASATGSGTHSASGTIPSNQPDPALSATRNSNGSQGTQSASGSGGTTASGASNSGASKSTASNAAATNASSTSKAPAKAASTPAAQPPSQTSSQTALQNNWNQAKNDSSNINQLKIPLEPVATPPPANSNAPKDTSGIALLDKPTPSNPSGSGKAVYNDTPSTPGGPALGPGNSNKETLGGLPSYSQGQGDQSQNQYDQPQNTGTQSSDTSNSSAGSSTGSGTQPSGGAANQTPSIDDADTSSDASSSAPAASQSKPVKVGTIPNSAPDPAFDAHRNDPNDDPNQADNSTSGGNTGQAGTTSSTGDSASPPASNGYPGGDAAAQANAQQSANNQAANDAANAAANAANQAAQQDAAQNAANAAASTVQQANDAMENARISAEMVKNNPLLGKYDMHLVGGDEGMEGVTDATPAVQMPVIDIADLSVEYGSTLTTASLSPIYKDYIVTPGQNGSSVIVAGTTQVQVPSAVMTVPSNQIQVPSSVMTVPSNQITVPSSQINVPSDVMNSQDLQPALCGR
jgi:hypothetical protein